MTFNIRTAQIIAFLIGLLGGIQLASSLLG